MAASTKLVFHAPHLESSEDAKLKSAAVEKMTVSSHLHSDRIAKSVLVNTTDNLYIVNDEKLSNANSNTSETNLLGHWKSTHVNSSDVSSTESIFSSSPFDVVTILGDSLVDTGNFYNMTRSPFDFSTVPPYTFTDPFHKYAYWQGRMCDGPCFGDYIPEFTGCSAAKRATEYNVQSKWVDSVNEQSLNFAYCGATLIGQDKSFVLHPKWEGVELPPQVGGTGEETTTVNFNMNTIQNQLYGAPTNHAVNAEEAAPTPNPLAGETYPAVQFGKSKDLKDNLVVISIGANDQLMIRAGMGSGFLSSNTVGDAVSRIEGLFESYYQLLRILTLPYGTNVNINDTDYACFGAQNVLLVIPNLFAPNTPNDFISSIMSENTLGLVTEPLNAADKSALNNAVNDGYEALKDQILANDDMRKKVETIFVNMSPDDKTDCSAYVAGCPTMAGNDQTYQLGLGVAYSSERYMADPLVHPSSPYLYYMSAKYVPSAVARLAKKRKYRSKKFDRVQKLSFDHTELDLSIVEGKVGDLRLARDLGSNGAIGLYFCHENGANWKNLLHKSDVSVLAPGESGAPVLRDIETGELKYAVTDPGLLVENIPLPSIYAVMEVHTGDFGATTATDVSIADNFSIAYNLIGGVLMDTGTGTGTFQHVPYDPAVMSHSDIRAALITKYGIGNVNTTDLADVRCPYVDGSSRYIFEYGLTNETKTYFKGNLQDAPISGAVHWRITYLDDNNDKYSTILFGTTAGSVHTIASVDDVYYEFPVNGVPVSGQQYGVPLVTLTYLTTPTP